MSAEHELEVGESYVLNENTEFQCRLQSVDLLDQNGVVFAVVDVYLDKGFYSAYWKSGLSPEQLVVLCEKTLAYFETNYANGVNRLSDAEEGPSAANVVYFKSDKNSVGEMVVDFPYERPLSWERIQQHAGGSKITFLRINSLIASFCLQIFDEKFNFGFMSHLAEIDGFAELLASSGSVDKEKAEEFFQAALGLLK